MVTTFVRFLLGFMLVFTALFLIMLVLLQRGRGGGLSGALGGMGGQSAFGTKAGDLFTKITVGVAAFWIVLCILANNLLGRQQSLISGDLGGAVPQATVPMTPTAPMTQPGGPAAAVTPGSDGTTPASTPAPQPVPTAPDAATSTVAPSPQPAAEKPAGGKPATDAPAAQPPAAEKPAAEASAAPEPSSAPAK